MKRTLTAVILLVAVSATFAQTAIDWTKYGFTAEPGVAVGTPCVGNLMARFWYRNFGVSTCGIYVPSGVNFLSGYGGEADAMYKFTSGGRQMIEPYVALGYGASNINSTVGTQTIQLITNYVGLQVGAYYNGAFAQVGFGVGKFWFGKTSSLISTQVFPLLQIGYTYALGGSSGGSSGGGSSGGGSSGGGSSGGGGGKK